VLGMDSVDVLELGLLDGGWKEYEFLDDVKE
jgi:hypothetical protein